jgi:hypothetical protein
MYVMYLMYKGKGGPVWLDELGSWIT